MSAKVLATRIAAGSATKIATTILANARHEAESRIAAARSEADAIRSAARAAAEAERAGLLQAAVATIGRRRDQLLTDGQILAVREVLVTAARLEERFNALSPWLESLIAKAVNRIVGTLEPTDLHRRIVLEALHTARPVGQLRLRLHPDDARAFAARVTGADVVTEVISDPTLSPGACILDCPNGLQDLCVQAQLDVVLREIAAAAKGGAV
jgi:flagellar biosynthesis/type III secretory pathway protein FliH